MIFAISHRFPRNSARAPRRQRGKKGKEEREGNLLGKREEPLVRPMSINSVSERETGNAAYASVPFGK